MKLTVVLGAAWLTLVAATPGGWQWTLPSGIAPPPVPADNPMSAAKVELGRRLFYDADLSVDGSMSCASCHEQKHAFADGNQAHTGVTGEPGRRNVQALANVAWFSPLTYASSKALTLEDQAHTPVLGTHPVEMGMAGKEAEIGKRLSGDACYREMFARAFPGEGGHISFAKAARAIASFERTLISFGSAYDRGTMSAAARRGQARFNRDCATCHAGPHFTDLAFHQLVDADAASNDQGLFEENGVSADRGKFRTPSLRNIALTGPWWHDGTATSIEEAISRHRLNVYSPAERAELQAFLHALSDEEFTRRPSLGLPDSACGKPL